MSKKAARRKTTNRAAKLPQRPLILPRGQGQRLPLFWSDGEDFKGAPRYTPRDGTPYWTGGTGILGVDVPADLGKAISAHGEETFLDIDEVVNFEPWRFFDYLPADDGSRYTTKKLEPGEPPPPLDEWKYADLGDPKSWTKNPNGGWNDFLDFSYAELMVVHAAINTAMAHGFFLALVRYAEDLKSVPEAAAICAALERGRRKGADTVHKKAAPKKMAIRKRFRELRKSGFTKTDARRLLEQETKISFRQIERDTAGLS